MVKCMLPSRGLSGLMGFGLKQSGPLGHPPPRAPVVELGDATPLLLHPLLRELILIFVHYRIRWIMPYSDIVLVVNSTVIFPSIPTFQEATSLRQSLKSKCKNIKVV